MQHRSITLFNGQTFDVPTHVVRLDHKKTHGWQLRYGRSMLFSDHTQDGSGAATSLAAACAELARRIDSQPAPHGVRSFTHAGKGHNMPVGVSGPIQRQRNGQGPLQYYLQVTFPVHGGKPANRSVYIATENTLTLEKYHAALAKANALRATGVRKFKLATTKAKREQARTAGLVH